MAEALSPSVWTVVKHSDKVTSPVLPFPQRQSPTTFLLPSVQFSCSSDTPQAIFLLSQLNSVCASCSKMTVTVSSLHYNHTGVTSIGIYVFNCSLYYSDSECLYLHLTPFQLVHLIAVVASMTKTLVMMMMMMI
jgi:hypothetical protein